ncbi:hypothetical protein [Rhodopirellula halodulae]|uniref:hypothetical protein n=1 Tax=Rhodopirellula halodulae TaxID=2894198 RepID=UPI001E4862B9|nr:hypothetical protein [Rhodopirellula sp. JC737]MCC9658601.1 hypothetical protein [Rhodopirellula sp. JC737]
MSTNAKSFVLSFGLAVAFLSTMVGCGPSGISLSGTAAVDGVPISKGKISLVPKPNVDSPTAMAPILDGEFTIPADAQLREGEFEVRVSITADRAPRQELTFLGGGDKKSVGKALSKALKDAPPAEENFTSELDVTGSLDDLALNFSRSDKS